MALLQPSYTASDLHGIVLPKLDIFLFICQWFTNEQTIIQLIPFFDSYWKAAYYELLALWLFVLDVSVSIARAKGLCLLLVILF